jgi:pectin methylesterase-like acyl-CoA thioesterase/polygalacturonase
MRNRRPAAGLFAVPALLLAALAIPATTQAATQAVAQAVAQGASPAAAAQGWAGNDTPDTTVSVGTAPAPPQAIAPGAVVLTVAPGGADGAQFASVQAAVDAVPDDSATPYVIELARGTYAERVTIPASKQNLTLLGATGNPRDVVITAADYNQETNPATGSPFGTEGSATVHVKASGFTAQNITFANTFDKTAHPGATGTQAVAIAMEGDRQVYLNDIFYGHQDTLLTWDSSATTHLRQYVFGSEIDGDVDFIFGDGQLVVDRSMINALNDGIYKSAYLTAPATPAEQQYGILISDSTVNTTLANNNLFLGRAWRPNSDADPQVLFRDTVLPQAINTAGPWLGISGATWSPGRYGESGDTGPGAGASPASTVRPVLPDATPQQYLAGTDGWDPVAPPTAPRPAIGDRRIVTEPRLPAVTCATLAAQLPGGTREFSAADEAAPLDTARIQATLDSCAGTGGGVLLSSGALPSGADDAESFLSGPLTVHAGEYLVVDSGVTLFASLDATAYQEPGKATCGSIGPSGTGCVPFISVNGRDAGVEGVPGHGRDGDRWGTIDGRGDLPVLGTDTSWYQIAATATAEGLKQVNPRLIQATSADDVTFSHIRLVDSAKQHLFISKSIGATVWGIQIATPDNTFNTDGVDVDSSTEVTVAGSDLMDGDDCVALTTNSSAASAVTVRRLHCYGTHGLSIGSGTTFGLDSIMFWRNTLNGYDAQGNLSTLDNGIRLKSFPGGGGVVTNVVYADTCMSAIKNLIVLNPNYDPPTGTTIPWFKSVTIDRALAIGSVPGASSVIDGYSADFPAGVTLRDVSLDTTAVTAQFANITLDRTDLSPSGPGVTVTTAAGDPAPPMHCAFPPFPEG